MTTESGTYRVFPSDREADGDGDEWLFVATDGGDPVYVGEGEGVDASLEPGHLVEATLDWTGADGPAVVDCTVTTRTRFTFVDGTADIFDHAKTTFRTGHSQGEPVASNVTYDTDGRPNGVVYTVAKQDGSQDVFEGFRTGRMTLEPMLAQLGDGDAEPPYDVFVIRPETEPFVVVYFTLRKDGLLADTIRDEYVHPN